MGEHGAPTLWDTYRQLAGDVAALEHRVGGIEVRQAVIDQRLSSIERTQTRIIAMLTSVLIAIVASGIGVILTVLLTKK